MKSIIITGAGSGIGKSTAERFLEAGWRVGLVGRRAEPLQETADGHDQALVLPCDVSDEADVAEMFGKAHSEWGHLDALFNNAGINIPAATVDEIAVADWRQLIDINLTGSFVCAQAAFRLMKVQEPQGGRIINNGSISAHAPRWGSAAYTASKHAITGLTKSVSLDGRPYNIACGQIDIGNALTEMARRMTKGVPQADGEIKVEPVMDVHIERQRGHVQHRVCDM